MRKARNTHEVHMTYDFRKIKNPVKTKPITSQPKANGLNAVGFF